MPLFTQETCDMPKSNDSTFHCDMADMDCCDTMTACVTVPFLPITSAPLNKVELQKDLIIDYFISYTDNLDLFEDFAIFQITDELCDHEIPPGFQTPLLV